MTTTPKEALAEIEAPEPFEISRALDAFARLNGFEAEQPRYIEGELNLTTIGGERLYSDEAHLWCAGCAQGLLAKALPLLPEGERKERGPYIADASTGEDSPSHCMKCGRTLDHTLTNYAVGEELAHYEEYPPADICPSEAFCIARIVDSATGDDVPPAVALGMAALALVRAGKTRPDGGGMPAEEADKRPAPPSQSRPQPDMPGAEAPGEP